MRQLTFVLLIVACIGCGKTPTSSNSAPPPQGNPPGTPPQGNPPSGNPPKPVVPSNPKQEQPPANPLADKPYVEIALGSAAYSSAAPQLTPGKTAKFKAEIAYLSTKGKQVKLHLGELYTGDAKAIQATELTKDFAANKAEAEKKYKNLQTPSGEVIVEGEVVELRPKAFAVILAGHKE